MPRKHTRYYLKAKESRQLLEKASKALKVDTISLFKDKAEVEVIETEYALIVLINGKPSLFKIGEHVHPTLKFDEYLKLAPKVIVDMGAVPHVCKGANVMAPGIRSSQGQFSKNTIVSIVDETHGKPIALGEILYGSDEVRNVKQGVVVKNMHYVGDKLWNLLKEIDAPTQSHT